MKILAIDPGNEQSAYVIVDENYKIYGFGKVKNDEILEMLDERYGTDAFDEFVIEMIENLGMSAVGKTLFETAFWIGRFWQAYEGNIKHKVYRSEEKLNLCGTKRAKDGNIIQALKDRFGDKGTKAKPGWFYGFKADCWQAYAVGVTYIDIYHKGKGRI